jgi:archaemetzincin
MHEALQAAIKPFERPHVRYLGVTRLDIYAEDTNYIFAQQRGNNAVISYRRFMYDVWDEEVPKRSRLIERFVKQCVSSTGRMFGISACSNPTCVAAYPNSVEELDAKGTKFCPSCLKALEQAVHQEGGH